MTRRAGPTDTLTDVAGLRVGHATRIGDGWLSGTTVVVSEDVDGVTAAVDVRGGGPGTRETDLLRPGTLVERVHAIVLTGGSAYGLAAASGVANALGAAGIGLQLTPQPGTNVPIVPAAVIFDLGRGGDPTRRPGPDEGALALHRAKPQAVEQGAVGAGTGARAGAIKGGVGSASEIVNDQWTVGALVVLNAAGSPLDSTGRLLASDHGFDEAIASAGTADPVEVARLQAALMPAAANTIIGVVATDARLTKARCERLAMAAHDGIARAVRPAHLLVDGDTVFGLSTGTADAPDDRLANLLLVAAADCFERAIGHAVLAATSAGGMRSFADLAVTGSSRGTDGG